MAVLPTGAASRFDPGTLVPRRTAAQGATHDAPILCEIRVPTYRRPKLLKRALLSIIEQTCSDWRCVVFDDCPNASAKDVVDEIGDNRISYSKNQRQLGAAGNIDQAFVHKPLFGGMYAFVLEDDNYLLPSYIERSIDILNKQGTKVVFCNQFCEIIEVAGEPGKPSSDLTLNWMYEPGTHDPDDLLPALLFSHGFSNGAVFWSTDCLSDFQIGAVTENAGIQESLRLLRLQDRVHVSLEATSVWRPRELLPKVSRSLRSETKKLWRTVTNQINKLKLEGEMTKCRSAVLTRLGVERVLGFAESNEIPDFEKFRNKRVAQIERSLLLCGYNSKLTDRGSFRRYGLLIGGFIMRRLPS
jgi:glycosyltransferase involved in cell wall biosynthesis